jgi:hypothetical protein
VLTAFLKYWFSMLKCFNQFKQNPKVSLALAVILFLFSSFAGFANTPPQQTQLASKAVNAGDASTPFTLSTGIEKTLVLPQGMYGQWQVQATLLETTRPDLFPEVVNDIWILERYGAAVRLTNPATKASATVFVDEVSEASAAFHHTSENRQERFVERPRITLLNDSLVGYTAIERQRLDKAGSATYTATARYRLEAYRLGQPQARFEGVSGSAKERNALGRNPLSAERTGEPDIEISPIVQGL